MNNQSEPVQTRNAEIAAELRAWADKVENSPFDVHGLALAYFRELPPIEVVMSDPTQSAAGFFKYVDERILDKFDRTKSAGLVGIGG